LVLDVAVLRIEALHSPLLHAGKYAGDVYTSLLYLPADLSLFDELLDHLLDLVLFNIVGLR
jgi:hypothetical protein